MKIGIWHNTGRGGARRYLYQHVEGLLGRGHELVSCCPDVADSSYLDLGSIISERRLALPHPFEREKLQSKSFNYARVLQDALDRHSQEAAAYLSSQGIDVLLAGNCYLGSVPSIAMYMDVPTCAFIQDPWRGYYEAIPSSPWAFPEELERIRWLSYWGLRARWADFVQLRNKRIFVAREIANATAFDLRLVNSRYSRETLLRTYGLPSTVCYPGIDTQLFRPLEMERELILLGVGSLWVNKNVDFLLRAVSKCRRRWPLVWIANGASETAIGRYTKLANQLNVDFRPLAKVSDQELVEWYNRARVHVCAPRLEPFGYTPLEAGACGLPTVATWEGGLRETIDDGVTGILLDENEQSFAAAIDHVMEDRALLQTWGERAQKLVREKWTLVDSVRRLESHLCALSQKSVVGGQ